MPAPTGLTFDAIAAYRKALFDTGLLAYSERDRRMTGGPLAELYNWLANVLPQ